MVRLLVRVKDNLRGGHPYPAMAARPGDIMAVLEDDHVFGSKEVPPDWTIVDVPGAVASFRHYSFPETEVVQAPDGPEDVPVKRRLFRIERNLLSASEKIDYDAGALSVTRRIFEDTCRNKKTGQTESERLGR